MPLPVPAIAPSEITPRALFEQRRAWLRQAGLLGAGLAAPPSPRGRAP
jgi:hypothetical protein